MDFSGKVSVEKRGRSGHVRVVVDGRTLRFHWEYGGGDCVAMVEVPDEAAWAAREPHREYERKEFLAGLAREIARRECPQAIIEIGPETVYFRARPMDR